MAIMALFLGLTSVTYAQGTAPTVSTVAITSNPGTDNTYATGDTITVTLTFSEAVTVDTTNGTPRITLDIGGQPRHAAYSGDGSSAAAQAFSYTLLVSDTDTDGVSVLANSLALDGGTIQATDDSANATLTHSTMTFANHNVDTQVILVSNLNQAESSNNVTISDTQGFTYVLTTPSVGVGEFSLQEITLDVKTPSDTLDVTVRAVSESTKYHQYTYSGSVKTAGLQTFTLSSPGAKYGNMASVSDDGGLIFDLHIEASGTGSVELVGTDHAAEDTGSLSGWRLSNPPNPNPGPRIRLAGYPAPIPDLLYGEVISSPRNGTAYTAGERIEMLYVFGPGVEYPENITVPFWFGDGAEHRREARRVFEPGYRIFSRFIFGYTVQPADTDADGIYIPANPLGDNADPDIVSYKDARIPANVLQPEQQLGANQAVDGSSPRLCQEVFCTTVVAGARVDSDTTYVGLDLYDIVSFHPYNPIGGSNGLTFEHGDEEYAITAVLSIESPDNPDRLELSFQPEVPQDVVSRWDIIVDGTLYRSTEAWFAAGYAFIWRDDDLGLSWAKGAEIDVNIIEAATATFDAATYDGTEGDAFDVTITLDEAFATTTVTLPITVTANGGAVEADYSGIPEELTFAPGDASKTFTVTVVDDTEDDDGESITLSFTDNHIRPGGANETATITLTDNDDPEVKVEFGASAYTVAEGASQSITVTLNADPERTLIIPIEATGQDGATAADYSGVPSSVTFSAGEMEKSFTFAATQDTLDDDDESVKLSFGAMPDARITPGTPDEVTFNIVDDDDPLVTAMFTQNAYTVAEGDDTSTTGVEENKVAVTVTLSADPERTVVIPMETDHQGGATAADYSGVPSSVTFAAGDRFKSFTFMATDDTEDDDDESVKLSFGTMPDARITPGTPDEVTLNIVDDDDPQVSVRFVQAAYSVAEGEEQAVRVTLSANPERTVVIPLAAMEQDGASSADYSGVPSSVTFAAGDRSKSFTFMATDDDVGDDGESVLLRFGTLPSRVNAGSPNEATVTIRQFSDEFILDCNTSVWCADLEFADQSMLDWGWPILKHGRSIDPSSSLSDDSFTFRGVEYRVRDITLHAGTYPTMPNTWSSEEQGNSTLSIIVDRGRREFPPPKDHYRDWVLHIDGLELPFLQAIELSYSEFVWVTADLQQLYNDWTPSDVTKIGIEEVAAADQLTNFDLPWPTGDGNRRS